MITLQVLNDNKAPDKHEHTANMISLKLDSENFMQDYQNKISAKSGVFLYEPIIQSAISDCDLSVKKFVDSGIFRGSIKFQADIKDVTPKM